MQLAPQTKNPSTPTSIISVLFFLDKMATQFCTRCKKTKTLDQFTLKRDGQSYWAQCTLCRHKGSGHELDGTTKPRKPKAHTLDETLPLTPLADFLNYLTAQNTDLDLETRLSIPTLSGFTTTKEKAEELKTMINAVIPYCSFTTLSSFPRSRNDLPNQACPPSEGSLSSVDRGQLPFLGSFVSEKCAGKENILEIYLFSPKKHGVDGGQSPWWRFGSSTLVDRGRT